jgi:hypothetical protein
MGGGAVHDNAPAAGRGRYRQPGDLPLANSEIGEDRGMIGL